MKLCNARRGFVLANKSAKATEQRPLLPPSSDPLTGRKRGPKGLLPSSLPAPTLPIVELSLIRLLFKLFPVRKLQILDYKGLVDWSEFKIQ